MNHQVIRTPTGPVASAGPLASSVSNAGAQLGINFMRNLSNNQTDNVVISPISIQIILNMILLGAKLNSQTEQELIEHIGYEEMSNKSANKDNPHVGMHQVSELLAKSVTTNAGLKFELANLILAKQQPSSEYLKSVEKFYQNTKFEQISNKTQANELEQRINKWVASATKNHITNLANDLGDISSLLLVLVNAAFFQGKWLYQFAADQTTDQPFYNHGLDDQLKTIKFMQQSGSFRSLDLTPVPDSESVPHRIGGLSKAEMDYLKLAKKLDCRVISLPFSANKGQELDMIILLPNKRNGLKSLMNSLNALDLKMIFEEIDDGFPVRTRVELPKFSFETVFSVSSAMQTMGVTKVFSPDAAELNRMYQHEPAFVNNILHKAKISVDEKGAEAAAATIATVSVRSGGLIARQPFKADHPFLFVIRHKPSGMPTFLGSVIRF